MRRITFIKIAFLSAIVAMTIFASAFIVQSKSQYDFENKSDFPFPLRPSSIENTINPTRQHVPKSNVISCVVMIWRQENGTVAWERVTEEQVKMVENGTLTTEELRGRIVASYLRKQEGRKIERLARKDDPNFSWTKFEQ